MPPPIYTTKILLRAGRRRAERWILVVSNDRLGSTDYTQYVMLKHVSETTTQSRAPSSPECVMPAYIDSTLALAQAAGAP
jgi:hypothetical protein